MFDEDDFKARAREIVRDAAPADVVDAGRSGFTRPTQRIGGSGNIAVNGNHNNLTIATPRSAEGYDVYLTEQLEEELRALRVELHAVESRHATVSLLKLIATVLPPSLGVFTIGYLPSGLSLAAWILVVLLAATGFLWGTVQEARMARAQRALDRKIDVVHSHLLQRNNWHPLGRMRSRA